MSEDDERAASLNKIAQSFGFHLNIPKLIEAVYSLNIGKTVDLSHFHASSVGFGLVHLIPILDALAFAPDGGLIIIEQPEAHLHPEVHAKLADMFIEMAKLLPNAKILIETHSDHLLSRIGRRMKDAVYLKPSEVKILYVDQSAEGVSKVENLDINPQGEFQWPLGFISSKIQDQLGPLPPIDFRPE